MNLIECKLIQHSIEFKCPQRSGLKEQVKHKNQNAQNVPTNLDTSSQYRANCCPPRSNTKKINWTIKVKLKTRPERRLIVTSMVIDEHPSNQWVRIFREGSARDTKIALILNW